MPDSSGYVVGWGSLALINAGLAQGKRQSGLLWFLVSLLLGPIATFLIVIQPLPSAESRPLPPRVTAALGILGFVVLVVLVALLVAGAT
jgi:hypothetical protein